MLSRLASDHSPIICNQSTRMLPWRWSTLFRWRRVCTNNRALPHEHDPINLLGAFESNAAHLYAAADASFIHFHSSRRTLSHIDGGDGERKSESANEQGAIFPTPNAATSSSPSTSLRVLRKGISERTICVLQKKNKTNCGRNLFSISKKTLTNYTHPFERECPVTPNEE